MVYKIPSNSSSLNRMSDAYETLEEILIHGWVVNIKTFLVSDSNDFLPIDQTFLLDSENFRNTKDKTCNTLGKYLSEVCLTHNLKLLNGRTIGDLTGKYTCYKYNGNSIVGYIMTQTTMFQKVVHFKVKPVTLWLDHCEIQAELAIRKRSSLENAKPIKNSKVKI